MPKRHQQRPAKESAGRNNPKKSTVITTGTYKKPETYREEAIEHKDPYKTAQDERVPASFDPTEGRSHKAESQEMAEEGEKRSGSDSNAGNARKGSRLHDEHKAREQPQQKPEDPSAMYDRDLRPFNEAGEDHGPLASSNEYALSAEDIKGLHYTLADLTDDELKSIMILPAGTRLEQGAKYIDLSDLARGEFVAMANMTAEEGHYYVPKKDTDYLLWNRLNQVSNPARLDENGPITM
jgi:hypothetical protein